MNITIITAHNCDKRGIMGIIFNGLQYEQIGVNVDIWCYPKYADDIKATLTENEIEYD